MVESVLITGGCGFIGSNLVRSLLDRGAKVRVLDNLSKGRAEWLGGLKVELIKGDIRNTSALSKALEGIESVIHLAAYGSVIESIVDPMENFDVNVSGTLILLRACQQHNVRRFILASTGGALIGNAVPPVNENSLPKPISPYGASKLCAEAYCHAFSSAYGMQTIALRFANVYGPQSAHKKGAITAFINAIMTGQPIVIYGDGSASRDFLYVDDLCGGIGKALEVRLSEPACVLHLASGVETTILGLAKALREVAGWPDYPIEFKPARRGEVERNFASYERARVALGFEPKVSLEEGLRMTLDWFHQNGSKRKSPLDS